MEYVLKQSRSEFARAYRQRKDSIILRAASREDLETTVSAGEADTKETVSCRGAARGSRCGPLNNLHHALSLNRSGRSLRRARA
jgi:hypothetical protein